jgi:glycerate kinase
MDAGCRRILLGLGGSASTDGGAGMLQALGAKLLDAEGHELAPGGAALAGLARIDLKGLDPRLADAVFVVATDVDNPLLGPHGAAAVFAPQKGATPDDVDVLERGLSRWADVVEAATGRRLAATPGAGAAGGVGFAAIAYLDPQVRPGIEVVLEALGFDDVLVGADAVVTGEGSLDQQSLSGKAPIGVAAAAASHGVPVLAVAGRTTLDPHQARGAGLSAVLALTDLEPDLTICIKEAGRLLEELAPELLRVLDAQVAGHST